MGKKREKIEIRLSDEELIPSTIGVLEETKKGSLGLIILFLIFIVFVLFLPNITNGINKLLGDEEMIIIPSKEEEKDKEEDNEKISNIYSLTDDLEITYNGIKFKNFSKNTNWISMIMVNENDVDIDFEKERYFLETYSEDQTLLGRHIFNNVVLSKKSSKTLTLELSEDEYNNLSKILIVKKDEKDYPKVSLLKNDNNQFVLTCKKNTNDIIYTFDKKEELIRIQDTINFVNDNSDIYSSNLSFYQGQTANLNNAEGISSSLVEVSTGFTVTTQIDVKKSLVTTLVSENYYKEASPKVIHFEMESRGYSCN